jgi:RNA polymerase sigma-70 factor (ECF subfamily)
MGMRIGRLQSVERGEEVTAIDLLRGAWRSRVWGTAAEREVPDAQALVAAARLGDRNAFENLYRRFSPMVHGILLAKVPRQEAEDLVQDVFLVALRQLPALREAAAFPGWLAAIARNRANDHHRRTVDTTEVPDDLPSEREVQVEALGALAAIRSLPEPYRVPLILRLVEGMTGDEIAARTGLTPASVRVNLHRGMKQLREKLGMRRNP